MCSCPSHDCTADVHSYIDDDGETRQSKLSQADIDRIGQAAARSWGPRRSVRDLELTYTLGVDNIDTTASKR